MRVRTAPDFKAPALRSRVRSSAARGDARGGDERRGAPVDESPSTSSGTVAELVALMSRFAPSGVAMLRGGSTAIMHHASVAGGGSGVRPASWSPSLTLSVELMSGFLGGIQIDPDEANALISGDGDAQKAESLRAYVRSLRAMMGVGVPPLPGTHLSPEVAIPGGYPARWLVPPRPSASSASGAPRRRVVAWIHGGAFLFCGGTTTHARLLSSVGLAADARVFSVEYPLAPDANASYASMLDAALAAYAWLVSRDGGGVDPRDVVLGGDSAGGHLALGLVREIALRKHDKDDDSCEVGALPLPAGVALMSPWCDPGRERESSRRAWASATRGECVDYLRGVEASMDTVDRLVFGAEEARRGVTRCLIDREAWDGRVMDVRSLPPALVQCGGAEVLATEARRFRDVASDAGWENVVLEEWADMPHVFQVFDAVAPEGGEAIASVGAFAKRVTWGDD